MWFLALVFFFVSQIIQVTSHSPFVGSSVSNRLRKHLLDIGILDGETMHSLRSGCCIMLSMLGIPYEQIAKHVGWKSISMAMYYYQVDKVMFTEDPSLVIAASTQCSTLDLSAAEKLGIEFTDKVS